MKWVLPIGLAAALASTCGMGPRGVHVDRADVRLNLLLDGSVEVRETLTLGTGPAVTTFVRDVAGNRIDDFIDVSAWIGNRRLPEGDGAGHATITRGKSLRVRWQFLPVPDRAQTFTLQFRATGVLALEGTHAVFRWDGRPAGLGLSVGPVHLEFSAPPQTVFIVVPALEEAGWTLSTQPDHWLAEKAALGPEEPVTVAATLAAGSLALAQPAWQYRAARARELMPAFIACGPFLLIVGAGVLGLMRLQYPAARPGEASAGSTNSLPPALAAALSRRRRSSTWRAVQATAGGLLERGVFEIAGAADGDAKRGVMTARQTTGLLRHEQIVADEVWLGARNGRIGVGEAVQRLRRTPASRMRRAIVDDLVVLGFVDRDRDAAAKGLRNTGITVIGLGFVLAALSPLAIDAFGVWLLVIPVSFIGVGAIFVVAASRFSILTAAGQRARAEVGKRANEIARLEGWLERV